MDNNSTNSFIVETKTTCDEPLKTKEFSYSPNIGKVKCCYVRKLVEDTKLKKYHKNYDLNHEIVKKDEKITNSCTSINSTTKHLVKTNVSIFEIERLYLKYFSKSVKDKIVIIANILNIIVKCKELYELRTKQTKDNTAQPENRYEVVLDFLEHNFKITFTGIIMKFDYSEFDLAFKMLFISILCILKSSVHPIFNDNFCENVVLCMWEILKKSGFKHEKVFKMMSSDAFLPDSINLINIIEDSLDSNLGIIDCMSIFFSTLAHTTEYFKCLIDALNNSYFENIAIFFENAISQCYVNSKFNDSLDPSSSSNSEKSLNTKTLEMSEKCSTICGELITTESDIALNGNFKENEPAKTSQQIHSVSESYSKESIQTGSICVIQDVQSTMQENNEVLSTSFSKPKENMVYIGDKWYHIITPETLLQAYVYQDGKFLKIKKLSVTNRCYQTNCSKAAQIMCGSCKLAKYCTDECQKLDWYERHINYCEEYASMPK